MFLFLVVCVLCILITVYLLMEYRDDIVIGTGFAICAIFGILPLYNSYVRKG